VASDVLVIDGRPLSGEDPRVDEAADALGEETPAERSAALGRIGIGAVVVDPTAPGEAPPEVAGAVLLDDPDLRVVALADVTERRVDPWWYVAMIAAWTLFVAPLVWAAGRGLSGAFGPRRERRAAPGD
jgi:hypothetical protein